MDIAAINSAIIRGTWTNRDLDSMIDAVKYARSQLARSTKFSLRIGTKVKWTSTKNPWGETGTVTKIAQKYVTVNTGTTMWRVPANMLEVVE